MNTLKLIPVGNSIGVILPRELLARLRVEKGDTLFVMETPNGVEISPHDPNLARQMDAAESIMQENRDILQKLAR